MVNKAWRLKSLLQATTLQHDICTRVIHIITPKPLASIFIWGHSVPYSWPWVNVNLLHFNSDTAFLPSFKSLLVTHLLHKEFLSYLSFAHFILVLIFSLSLLHLQNPSGWILGVSGLPDSNSESWLLAVSWEVTPLPLESLLVGYFQYCFKICWKVMIWSSYLCHFPSFNGLFLYSSSIFSLQLATTVLHCQYGNSIIQKPAM